MPEPAGRSRVLTDVGPDRAVDVTPAGDGTLLFMHIPKSAGTSLRKALGDVYPDRERLHVYNPRLLRGAVAPKDVQDLPESRRRGTRLVFGHFYYGIHRVIPNPTTYITVLRDPIERVVSLYYHSLRGAAPRHVLDPRRLLRRGPSRRPEQELFRRYGESLESWIAGQRPVVANNGMVRMIAGRSSVGFGECSDDLLDEALEHIDSHFAAVLVKEAMPESIAILEAVTGRSLPALSHENANPKRVSTEHLGAGTLARIAELNELDLRLHRIALDRLPETSTRLGVASPLA